MSLQSGNEGQKGRIYGSLINGRVDTGKKGDGDFDGSGQTHWMCKAETSI